MSPMFQVAHLGLAISAQGYANVYTGKIVVSGKQRTTVLLRASVAARDVVVDEKSQPVADAHIHLNALDEGTDRKNKADFRAGGEESRRLPCGIRVI